MALFFNIKLLEEQSGTNLEKLVALLRYHYNKVTVAPYRAKYKPSRTSLHGSSFLLNPEPLLSNTLLNTTHVAQYIQLAGRRDYLMYKLLNQTHLDITYFPDLNLDAIKYNPLLIVSNQLIKFKFEEFKNGTKIR